MKLNEAKIVIVSITSIQYLFIAIPSCFIVFDLMLCFFPVAKKCFKLLVNNYFADSLKHLEGER